MLTSVTPLYRVSNVLPAINEAITKRVYIKPKTPVLVILVTPTNSGSLAPQGSAEAVITISLAISPHI